MTMVFLAVFLFGAVYFLFVRRIFDYFLLAYFCAGLYFLPGFFGVTRYRNHDGWVEASIGAEVYSIYFIVLLSLCMFSFFYDCLWSFKYHKGVYNKPFLKLVMVLVAALAVGSVALMLISAGGALWSPEKAAVMESIGRWHILFYSASMIGLSVSVYLKDKIFFAVFFFLLIFNMYIGFRSPLAVAVLSGIMVWASRQPKIDMIRVMKLAPIVFLFGFSMFFYKTIAHAVKSGSWGLVASRSLDVDTYYHMVIDSEPFITQAILNEVISTGYKTPPDHLYSAAYQLLLFAPSLGAKMVSFNDYFQIALFGELDYGMASNIWAQMWSVGSWGFIILMVILFNLVIVVANRSAALYGGSLAAILAPAFCYWVFYVHRNDLAYMINLEKRIFLVALIAILMAWLLRADVRRR